MSLGFDLITSALDSVLFVILVIGNDIDIIQVFTLRLSAEG